MNTNNEIRIYNVVSVADIQKHYHSIRLLIFGMKKDSVGDHLCNMNEYGHITYFNKSLLYNTSSKDVFDEKAIREYGRQFIERVNKKIADRCSRGEANAGAVAQPECIRINFHAASVAK